MLEATRAVFANTEIEGSARHNVFSTLGEMALQVPVEPETGFPAFSDDDYRYFESQQSPQEAAEIEYRTGLLNGFAPFSAEVELIKSELEHTPAEAIKGHLASGNVSDVFIVENEGKKFALRIAKNMGSDDTYGNADEIDTYLVGTLRAVNIDGMEQLVGLSYEHGATVGELLPGKPLGEYAAEEIASIPKEHYKKLARTLIKAAKVGISLDGNEGNLLYDTENGFGFVDFWAGAEDESLGIAQPVTTAVFGTDTWLPQGNIPNSEHIEDYVALKDFLSATIPTYDMWLSMLHDTQVEMGLAADYLTKISDLQKTLANMKGALVVLTPDGALEEQVQKSQTARIKIVEGLKLQLEKPMPDGVRESKARNLAMREHTPGRLFPRGTIRPTRNNSK